MDDMFAMDGGSAAVQWQKKHRRRKQRRATRALRALTKAEEKADLKKRRKNWHAMNAARRAKGLPEKRKGIPHDNSVAQYLDMTGQRFGRLTVIRVAPVSSNGKNHGRRWWVRCDCGSAEKRVAGTNLRQGLVKSCGCLLREEMRKRVHAYWESGKGAEKRAAKLKLISQPLSHSFREIRNRLRTSLSATEVKIFSEVQRSIVRDEVARGVRRARKRRAPAVTVQ